MDGERSGAERNKGNLELPRRERSGGTEVRRVGGVTVIRLADSHRDEHAARRGTVRDAGCGAEGRKAAVRTSMIVICEPDKWSVPQSAAWQLRLSRLARSSWLRVSSCTYVTAARVRVAVVPACR